MKKKVIPLKIAKKQTADIGRPIPETDDILIESCGVDFIKSFTDSENFQLSHDNFSRIEKECGTTNRFYYRLERFDATTVLCSEMGIGMLFKTEEGVALKRSQPMLWLDEKGEGTEVVIPQTIMFDNYNASSKLLITSVIPTQFGDVTIDPNVIVYSDENCRYNPLYVKENSLVGRFKSSIRNITFTELFKKVTQLSLTQLILTTPKKPKEVEGSIVYDDKTKSLKFFDGEVWKRLVNEDT
tara:strand:+ start:1194 stop:1916 length:723 start_codon:yes stop_codon:yes gene_type:complete